MRVAFATYLRTASTISLTPNGQSVIKTVTTDTILCMGASGGTSLIRPSQGPSAQWGKAAMIIHRDGVRSRRMKRHVFRPFRTGSSLAQTVIGRHWRV